MTQDDAIHRDSDTQIKRYWPALTEQAIAEIYDIPPDAISRVTGNAPLSIKEGAVLWYRLLGLRGHYGHTMRSRLEIREVTLEPSPDDPEKLSTKTVCELEVAPDMCNANGIMSQGCMAFLIDEGSAISLLLMRRVESQDQQVIGVSQTLNLFFHNPAPSAGTKIMIVSRSVSTQDEIGCCKSEIWDMENHRLIVSGAQLQMLPSTSNSSRQ